MGSLCSVPDKSAVDMSEDDTVADHSGEQRMVELMNDFDGLQIRIITDRVDSGEVIGRIFSLPFRSGQNFPLLCEEPLLLTVVPPLLFAGSI